MTDLSNSLRNASNGLLSGSRRRYSASRQVAKPGGHGSGRKWAHHRRGMLFDDPAMRTPSASYPAVRFGDDMQTALYPSAPYGPEWVGGSAIRTGHTGLWNGAPVSTDPAWGPYEHLAPAQWPGPLGDRFVNKMWQRY